MPKGYSFCPQPLSQGKEFAPCSTSFHGSSVSPPLPVNKCSLQNKQVKPRPPFKPQLEELGQRILPAIYYWDPTSGNNIDATFVFNGTTYYSNWDIGQMGSHNNPTALPSNGDQITFDGSSGVNGHGQYYNGNANCNVDVNLSGPVVLQNGFTSTITISDGITMSIWNYTDNDIASDFLNVAFAGPNAVQDYGPGVSVMGNFAWQAGGKTTVNGGGVIEIGSQANLNQSSASPLIINQGSVAIGPATANSGTSTFKLTNGSADINVNPNGFLNFNQGAAAATLVDNTGTAAQISNNGTTTLNGVPGGAEATIAVPFENHATFDAGQGGKWFFSRADTNNNDLYMDAGKIYMAGSTTLDLQDSYTQTGGTLEVADNQTETINSLTGLVNFNGGKIVFDSATGYGVLSVTSPVFNGVEIDMRIGGTNNNSDQIKSSGTCTIKGNSKLVVTATNPVQAGSNITWTLIQPRAGDKINGDFLAANITLPQNVSETAGALPNSWQCNS